MKLLERILLRLDEFPLAELLRVILGYALIPAWVWIVGEGASGWTLWLFLLGVLAALRLIPLVVRRVVRVDNSVHAIWFQRRQLAKRFDSYQWRKLLWIGIGLALYAAISGGESGAPTMLMLLNILGGAFGQLIWRRRSADLRNETAAGRSSQAPLAAGAAQSTGGNS